LIDSLGELVTKSFDAKSATAVKHFEGEVDLKDLIVGKLREEGGAPCLGLDAPDLLDLALSSSPVFTDTPASLSLAPTVSTFAQPCFKGIDYAVGFVPTSSEFWRAIAFKG